MTKKGRVWGHLANVGCTFLAVWPRVSHLTSLGFPQNVVVKVTKKTYKAH